MSVSWCVGCKSYKDIVYTEKDTHREFCLPCASGMATPAEISSMLFLMVTIPFKVGDKVEVRTGAVLLEGTGVVEEISMDLANGGTPVYPTFRVKILEKAHDDAPDEEWATECCLTKVSGE